MIAHPTSAEDPRAALEAAARDGGLAAAAAWKRQHGAGRRIVGCLPPWAPTPLVEALGMRAVLVGGPDDEPDERATDGWLPARVCAPARAVLAGAIGGRYADVDAFLVPAWCPAARNLAAVLGHVLAPRPVVLFHLPAARGGPRARAFLHTELERVARRLEDVAGRVLSDDLLTRALAEAQRRETAIRALQAQRAARPGALSAALVAAAVRGAEALPAAEAARLLAALPTAFDGTPPAARSAARVRVFGASCAVPSPALLDAVEDGGCTIVGDDMHPGFAWMGQPASPPARGPGRPLDALVDALLDGPPSSLREPPPPADGVLLMRPRFCDRADADAARIGHALRDAGAAVGEIEHDGRSSPTGFARQQAQTVLASVQHAHARARGNPTEDRRS